MLPRYSPVAPIHILSALQQKRLLRGYLLVLAHDVVRFPDEYAKLVQWMNDAHIIVDNGVIENGVPVSLEVLLQAAEIVSANVVVAPDMLYDMLGTMELCLEAVPQIQDAGYEVMLVPQGANWQEVCKCVDSMVNVFQSLSERVHWGVPRWMANEFGSRQGILNYLNNYARGDHPMSIHLLGMSRDLQDDLRCCQTVGVTGIDSANPLVLGWNNVIMNVGVTHMDRGLYWEQCMYLHDTMAHNVQWMNDALCNR